MTEATTCTGCKATEHWVTERLARYLDLSNSEIAALPQILVEAPTVSSGAPTKYPANSTTGRRKQMAECRFENHHPEVLTGDVKKHHIEMVGNPESHTIVTYLDGKRLGTSTASDPPFECIAKAQDAVPGSFSWVIPRGWSHWILGIDSVPPEEA